MSHRENRRFIDFTAWSAQTYEPHFVTFPWLARLHNRHAHNSDACGSPPLGFKPLHPDTYMAEISFRWEGQYNDIRTARTFLHTDWQALLKEAQILNGGRLCTLDGLYHAGGHHIVQRLKCIDGGELWLARIPILPSGSSSDKNELLNWWSAERRFTMESEIATMKFIAESTSIPVPKVFGHRAFVSGNPVKLPYLLMQCIRGNMLYDLGGPDKLTSDQKSRIRKSVAQIQYQMSTVSVNKLGSLILSPDGTIDIGPLPASFGFKGPFTSTADYFLSWAAHAKFRKPERFLEDNVEHVKLKQEVIAFPGRLRSGIEKRPPTNSVAHEDRYPIVHRDFLPHNILFDDKFNVVGVIDWEFAHSAPLEVFAALTNMYSSFDSNQLRAVPEGHEEGMDYIKDVVDAEESDQQGPVLSEAFGSILGDIGLCMANFEEGRAVLFGKLLDRYEHGCDP